MRHIIYILIIACLCTCGHRTTNSEFLVFPETDVISQIDMRLAFYPYEIHASDSDYNVVKHDHLVFFLEYYEIYLEKRGLEYHERWDCEDFTMAFITEFKIWFSQTELYPEKSDGIAVGEVWYDVDGDSSQGHSTAIVVTENGVVFVSTIGAVIYELTEAEWASISYIRF